MVAVRTRIKFATPVTDYAQFSTRLQSIVDVEVKKAMREWLLVLMEKVPTYTATARGTLVPVGRLVRQHIGHGSISAAARKKKYFQYKGRKYPTGYAQGIDYASSTLKKNVGHKRIQYTFTYKNELPYVKWNDEKAAPPWLHLPSNPPWNMLGPASKAFRNHILYAIPRRFRNIKLQTRIKYMRVS